MKKPFLLFSFSPLLLIPLALMLLLTACTPTQPGEQAPPSALPTPTLVETTAVETLPTNTLPAPTPTDVPTALPTELPTIEPTVEPTLEAPGSALKIVYVNTVTSPDTIVLWNDAGNTVLVSLDGVLDVRMSDDGAVVAFTRELSFDKHELWSVNTDGTNLHLMLGVIGLQALYPDALGVKPYQFDFIPGTHRLAFNTVQYIEGPGLFLYDDLHFIDTANNQLITQLTAGSGGNFVFSPNGLQYAIIKPESISLLNTDGSNIRTDVLTYPYVLTYSEYQYYAEPVWSPDSGFLRVAMPPQDSLGDPTALTTLWQISTDGSPTTQIGQVLAQPFFIDPVQFSPDLSHIAYTRLPDPNNYVNAELVLANSDGSSETVYATGNLFFNGWAPDSQHFGFENSEIQETYLGVAGGAYTLLTDIPYIWGNTWLDATHFLFFNQTELGWQMRIGTLGAWSTVIFEQPDQTPVFDFDH